MMVAITKFGATGTRQLGRMSEMLGNTNKLRLFLIGVAGLSCCICSLVYLSPSTVSLSFISKCLLCCLFIHLQRILAEMFAMSSVRRREIDQFCSTVCPLDSKLQSNPIHFHPRKLSAHSPVCSASWEVRCPQQCSLHRCNLELFAYRQHPASAAQRMARSFEDQEVHGLH